MTTQRHFATERFGSCHNLTTPQRLRHRRNVECTSGPTIYHTQSTRSRFFDWNLECTQETTNQLHDLD